MRFLILVAAVFLSSCHPKYSMSEQIDHMSFSWFGGTMFSTPEQVTMKAIHLDNGGLLGREIIVEGNIESIGKYHSHLVISDQTARMLIVLTELTDVNEVLQQPELKTLRILGTVERGKKGLPYVTAHALNKIDKSERKKQI